MTTEKTYRFDYTDVLFWIGVAIMILGLLTMIAKLLGLI
jgi:hypothetical protein